MFVLGVAYYEGDDVERDIEKCTKLLTKASKLGHIKATHDLGCFYYYGYGFPEDFKDLEKSKKLLSKSAELGYKPSISFLETMFK